MLCSSCLLALAEIGLEHHLHFLWSSAFMSHKCLVYWTAIGNTSIVALCNGIPVLISAAVSPLHTVIAPFPLAFPAMLSLNALSISFQDIRQPLVMCLLYLLNESRTRRYIRPQADIRVRSNGQILTHADSLVAGSLLCDYSYSLLP